MQCENAYAQCGSECMINYARSAHIYTQPHIASGWVSEPQSYDFLSAIGKQIKCKHLRRVGLRAQSQTRWIQFYSQIRFFSFYWAMNETRNSFLFFYFWILLLPSIHFSLVLIFGALPFEFGWWLNWPHESASEIRCYRSWQKQYLRCIWAIASPPFVQRTASTHSAMNLFFS